MTCGRNSNVVWLGFCCNNVIFYCKYSAGLLSRQLNHRNVVTGFCHFFKRLLASLLSFLCSARLLLNHVVWKKKKLFFMLSIVSTKCKIIFIYTFVCSRFRRLPHVQKNPTRKWLMMGHPGQSLVRTRQNTNSSREWDRFEIQSHQCPLCIAST